MMPFADKIVVIHRIVVYMAVYAGPVHGPYTALYMFVYSAVRPVVYTARTRPRTLYTGRHDLYASRTRTFNGRLGLYTARTQRVHGRVTAVYSRIHVHGRRARPL